MRITYVEQLNDHDCLAACVASILDFPAGVLPHPYEGEGEGWVERWRNELRPFGVVTTFIPEHVPEPHITAISRPEIQGHAHAVVTAGDRLIWDPAPGKMSRTSLDGMVVHWRMKVDMDNMKDERELVRRISKMTVTELLSFLVEEPERMNDNFFRLVPVAVKERYQQLMERRNRDRR
jgi:hypothetical protein